MTFDQATLNDTGLFIVRRLQEELTGQGDATADQTVAIRP